MRYVEISVEDAIKKCKKNAKVLVAEQDLTSEECDCIFVLKGNREYGDIFKDVQTVASLTDDLVKQLNLFTERQDIFDIKPVGIQKIILMI